jgi:preprotein translocase subunit SecG
MKIETIILAIILTIFIIVLSFLVSKEIEKIMENSTLIYGNKTWTSRTSYIIREK